MISLESKQIQILIIHDCEFNLFIPIECFDFLLKFRNEKLMYLWKRFWLHINTSEKIKDFKLLFIKDIFKVKFGKSSREYYTHFTF